VATLALADVTKVYDNNVEAVRGLSLDVDDGEFVVLVGPSGCGKTTALRMVAGLEEITSGTISLDGKVVNDLSAKARDVAMVFQNYALYPHLTAHDNIAFSLSMRGVGKAERDRRVLEAAHVLGLTEVLHRKPRHLSGGQRQRVAMGRALVREPAVFLMDEPLSNLDAKLRVHMRTEVLRVQRRLGVATLYVTHDQTEAMTMGDRVAVLREGVLQQLAPPQELYDRPNNLFVASFMGSPSMNLYEGGVGGTSELPVVTLGSQELRLTADEGRALRGVGSRVVVGIRPEHLVLPPVDGSGSKNGQALVAEVELVEALGNEQLIHFAIDAPLFSDAGETHTVDEASAHPSEGIAGAPVANSIARIDPETHVVAGSRLTFRVDTRRIHFFDPQTGASLDPTER
jgi:multiple sugar transport system ATP-binding protein